jgi:hypothetical protein
VSCSIDYKILPTIKRPEEVNLHSEDCHALIRTTQRRCIDGSPSVRIGTGAVVVFLAAVYRARGEDQSIKTPHLMFSKKPIITYHVAVQLNGGKVAITYIIWKAADTLVMCKHLSLEVKVERFKVPHQKSILFEQGLEEGA